MRIKTNELTGPALNWAVRYALNERKPIDYVDARDNFSTCWNKGGPIIEREDIDLTKLCPGTWRATNTEHWFNGPTPLIAAMRCYVASCLGDEVDVPEELV